MLLYTVAQAVPAFQGPGRVIKRGRVNALQSEMAIYCLVSACSGHLWPRPGPYFGYLWPRPGPHHPPAPSHYHAKAPDLLSRGPLESCERESATSRCCSRHCCAPRRERRRPSERSNRCNRQACRHVAGRARGPRHRSWSILRYTSGAGHVRRHIHPTWKPYVMRGTPDSAQAYASALCWRRTPARPP